MSFVVVYSWRVHGADRGSFTEEWKKARFQEEEGAVVGWNYRFSVEQELAGAGDAVFALHCRWLDYDAWIAALAALGASPSDPCPLLTAPMLKLVAETYAVETLSQMTRPRVLTEEGFPIDPAGSAVPAAGRLLTIRILEARNLVPKNANGVSDPYVVLKMPLSRKQRTSVKASTLDPRFNESFVFPWSERARLLKISVRSKDFFFRTHEIGRAQVDLRFYRDYSQPVWVPLVNNQGKKTQERGELLIQVVFGESSLPHSSSPVLSSVSSAASTTHVGVSASVAAPASPSSGPETRTWRELAPELQTGDLIFFESRGIPSKTIRWYTKSQYSHLGMVVLPRDIGETDVGDDVVLMVESHPNVRDRKDYRGNVSHGVQICTVLSKLDLVSYKRISIRKLVVQRTPQMMEQLREFLAEARDRPYTSNFLEVIRAGGTGRFGMNESHLESFHCTGVVAEVYIRWGLIPNRISSNNYSPWDIEALSLERGYLSDDIAIFRAYNPITRSIDLEPASLQTRYTISRALKAFQGGKQYKPGKALRLLNKHQRVLKDAEEEKKDKSPRSSRKQIQFEFETSETAWSNK